MVVAAPHVGGLHARVLDRLGRDLVRGDLPPDEVLSVARLEERYGASRSVVREVVRVLEALGVVASRRRVGITVRPPEQWEALSPLVVRWRLAGPGRSRQLRELSELRRGVEPAAAALAARRASDADVEALTEAVVGMSVTGPRGDLHSYLVHDVAFHRALLGASGNGAFTSLAPLVSEALVGRTEHRLMPDRPEPAAVRWHVAVAEAVAARDADEAEEVMRRIVDEAQAAMEARYEAEESGESGEGAAG